MYCIKKISSSKFDALGKFAQTSFIIILVFLSFSARGQKHFEKGYIVLKNNDTLHGLIKDRKPHPFARLYKKIKFKEERRRSKYGPRDIIAYNKGASNFESVWVENSKGFLNQNYNSVEGNGKAVFLKVIEKGFLTYYYWEFEDDDSGIIDYIPYMKKKDEARLIRVNQGIFGLRKKEAASFLSDCTELARRIREKDITDPVEIVRFYNDWKQRNP